MIGRYDFLVIGAGPAGCIVAAELKKMGKAVCVLEKEPENYRKVCGDGISFAAIKALKIIGFPLEYFEEADAVKIHKFIFLREDDEGHEDYSEEIQEEKGKLVYGLARNKTDAVFRRYLTENAGVEIKYENNVDNIVTSAAADSHLVYEINGLQAENIIISAGSSARIKLDGKLVVSPDVENPVGVSAIIRADNSAEPFFLFDFKKKYNGTYGWLFSVGDREYNAGLWLKTDRSHIKEYFHRFLDARVKEYLGTDFEIVCNTRGVIMGIGEKRSHYSDSVFIIGDTSNTSNPVDGEGISKAVLDAVELVSYLRVSKE